LKPIIEVRDVSKSFILSHEGKEKYTALRDVMANKAKKIFSFAGKLRANKSKEEFWALRDISFDVRQGDRVGIIGRNGAGKSTLLKILSRITEPTKGEIRIKGRVASLLEVGTGFHPELTGRENIFLNGAILGMSRAEIRSKFDEIVEFAEVERFLDTPVKRYSSGMYVRLAFAVAAHLEPEILVVDEVLAVGDAQFQKKCLGKMEDVSKNEGRTVLFVSHNMSAIKYLCNKGILLSAGTIDSVDDIGKIIDRYNNNSINDVRTPAVEKGDWKVTGVEFYQNGCRSSYIDVNEPVSVKMFFEAMSTAKISFEISVKDKEYNPILFLAFGVGQGFNFVCQPGKNLLSFDLQLPQLALGEYHLDVYIVESFVKRLAHFFNVSSFEVSSSFIPASGWNFEKTAEIGNIMHKAENIVYHHLEDKISTDNVIV